MLRSARGLLGFHLSAMDGDIGRVHDVFFDTWRWTVRYLVVDTGGWLSGRRVLISPIAITRVDWDSGSIEVRLSRRQVQNAPDVDVDRPLSRQHEIAFFRHFGWRHYWPGPNTWGSSPHPAALATPVVDAVLDAPPADEPAGDPNLRSAKEVTGYTVEARGDDDVGSIDDFIVDEDSWELLYMAVHSGGWWSGRRGLFATHWVSEVDWGARVVRVDLEPEAIRTAPEWEPGVPLARAHEEALHRHYGREPYWEQPGRVP